MAFKAARWAMIGAAVGAFTLADGAARSAARADTAPVFPREIVNDDALWRIVRPEWTDSDEAGFSAFIQALGHSDCDTLDDCLRSDANPYRHTDRHGAYYGDCADLPYFLRGYYAWKNGLPFSYHHAVRTADGAREDLRYSRAGNLPAGRRDILVASAGPPAAPEVLRRIRGEVSTAMFRIHPAHDDDGKNFSDFYPIKIDREAVRPGVLAYDIFGHAGVVYDVEDDGRIRIMSSHPDHTLTRSVYGQNYMRAHPGLGAGLKAWRPIRVVGADINEDGELVGGRIVGAANDDIDDYSLEQYYGAEPHPSGDWALGEFRYDGRTFRYHDYVRRVLAAPGFAYDPVMEVRMAMRDICTSVKARKVAVDRAIEAGVNDDPHPARLPRNIYGTYGDWEAFSTPSRDARLKTAFVEFRRLVQDIVEREADDDPTVAYDGDNLAADMLAAYDEEAPACAIAYTNSNGESLRLTFHNIAYRLFDLSFSPYQCIERRWGARDDELASCGEGADKAAWYDALRFLRNQASRSYDLRMDFARNELKSPQVAPPDRGGLGWAHAPDVNVRGYLKAHADGVAPLIARIELTASDLSMAAGGLPCVTDQSKAAVKIGNGPWARSLRFCDFSSR